MGSKRDNNSRVWVELQGLECPLHGRCKLQPCQQAVDGVEQLAIVPRLQLQAIVASLRCRSSASSAPPGG